MSDGESEAPKSAVLAPKDSALVDPQLGIVQRLARALVDEVERMDRSHRTPGAARVLHGARVLLSDVDVYREQYMDRVKR